ncbi:hypothetical protein, partial [Salmonella sp. s51228]|uniref:hypothetical protein n=1 Tax=Salmonella sp. s51228 TaxID=3159652 RepID=UPI00397F8C88
MHLAQMGQLDSLVYKVIPVVEEHQVIEETQVLLEELEMMEIQERREIWEHKDQKVIKDSKEDLELMGILVKLVIRATTGNKVQVVYQDSQEFKEQEE